MYELEPELRCRVRSVANRLRMLQIDLANEDATVQNECLREEIDRAMRAIVPEKREIFLRSLQACFPCSVDVLSQIPSGKSVSGEIQESKLDTFVRAVIHNFSTLSDAQKQSLLSCFEQSKSPIRQSTTGSNAAGMENVEIDRIVQVFFVILDFFSTLEPLVAKICSTILAQNANSSTQRIKTAIEGYISRNQKNDIDSVKMEIQKFRRLIAAILGSVSQLGKQMERKFQSSISPQSIETAVKLEGGSLLEGHATKCWKKYKNLFANWTEDAIDIEVQKIIADYVKKIL